MFLEFLLFKIYTRIFEKYDSMPWFRTYIYICLNEIFLIFSLNIIFEPFLEKIGFIIPNWLKIIVLFIILPILHTYFRFFFKRTVDYYENKYKSHWLNRLYFDGLLIFIPFFLFIIGPIVRVLIHGGQILKWKFSGLW